MMSQSEVLEDVNVPGTVHLVDLDGTMHVQHAAGGQRDIVLVPAPSSDPEDPLNWTPRRKALSTLCMCVYTLMVGIASAAIYSVLEQISDNTGLTLDDLDAGTGYMFLFFGWGCLFWQPFALQYGKRPAYLFSILFTMAIQIWAPYTTSNGQWIASKILQGFVGAPIESLCEISVCDIFFQHERGRYIGLYAFVLAGSNFFAPIISGFIADSQGWQWVLYWCAIFNAIGFVFLFFFMEETNYSRHVVTGYTAASDKDALPSPAAELASDEKKTSADSTLASDVEAYSSNPTYKPKTYADKLKLFRTADLRKKNHMLGMVTRPLVFLSFPVIFYAGFSYGSNLVWFNVLNGTASLILGDVYGFKASIVGVTYISPMIGVAIGSLVTGVVGDRVVLALARRNKGILEPEHRLWMFLPSLVLVPFGLILWGVGAAHHIHWFGCVFAMGVIALTNTFGIQISCSYALDSYKDLGGEAMVTVILVRNTMSFAVSYGITPWVTGMGYQNAFIVAAFAGIAQVCTIFIFIKWGKGMRRKSAPRYAKYVQQMAENGLMH